MKKLCLLYISFNVCFALQVLDQPDKNSNLLIIGDVNQLQLLNDNYVHVYDKITRIKGYVKYEDYQKALINADMVKRFPKIDDLVGKDEKYKDKAALIAENIKNKQAQLTQLKKRLGP
ncbi:MAG: hypothetical protein VX835_02690 [Pseudomonadota bacterium]|nr:hypothetical protein [Pseudomonadota bacterium]